MIAVWIYLAYSVSLVHPYYRIFSERAVLKTDYIAVSFIALFLALCWPIHLRKALGLAAFQR